MGIQCQSVSLENRRISIFTNRVGIVIPAYNEAKHLKALLGACRSIQPTRIQVVDDCSTDDTPLILANEADNLVHTVRNRHNLGKQGSVKKGLKLILEHELDAVAFIDGDGQHVPNELPRLSDLLKSFDFVIGVRSQQQMPIQRKFSNWLVNESVRIISEVNFVDLQSGLRIYSRPLAQVLAQRLKESGGYALELESLTLLARYAQEQDISIRAAAAPISCRYGQAQSSLGPRQVLQLTYETIQHAFRLRKTLGPTEYFGACG